MAAANDPPDSTAASSDPDATRDGPTPPAADPLVTRYSDDPLATRYTDPRADPQASAQPSGGLAIPGYEILGELGRGGMGVVYKARQLGFNRIVALKMILSGAHAGPEDLARFRAEAEAVGRLQHPHIVQVYEVGEHEGRPFFSMEFCPGGGLDRKLNGTPLPAKEAAALTEMLARAVHAAHLRNVIHRDLKPANVLLTADGTPKVSDFGLAKKMDEAGRTQSGEIMGTPSYMAPEQANGKSNVAGPATDVYALGAMLYECLTGRPPFKAATALDTILQVVAHEPVPPRRLRLETPRDLETVCLKCLRKPPAARYASACDLAEDLRRFLDCRPIQARPVGKIGRLVRWVRREPRLATAITIALGVIMTAVVLALTLWQQNDAFTKLQADIGRNHREIDAGDRPGGGHQANLANPVEPTTLPPQVSFQGFPSDETAYVSSPELNLAFVADSTESKSPLKRVVLQGEDGLPLFRMPTHPSHPVLTVEGEVRITVSAMKPTTFSLIAATERGAESRSNLTLQLVEEPLYVIIDKLESLRPVSAPFEAYPTYNPEEKRLTFSEEVPAGRVLLRGGIRWEGRGLDFKEGIPVRVFVNGFQQNNVHADAPAAGASECKFTAEVLLTRAVDNMIEVDLLGIPMVEGGRNRCVVKKCLDPIRERRLNIVLIAADDTDGEVLKRRALTAISAKMAVNGQLDDRPRFDSVKVFEPLTGGFSKGRFLVYLERIKKELGSAGQQNSDAGLADVLLVYYQGLERTCPDGDICLLTDDSASDADLRHTDISGKEVVDKLADMPGATILVLDAKDAGGSHKPDVLHAFSGSHIAVFNALWPKDEALPNKRLLELVGESWAGTGALGDLSHNIQELSKQQNLKMEFSTFVPADLTGLEFGGKGP